jgi:hypothetical protein
MHRDPDPGMLGDEVASVPLPVARMPLVEVSNLAKRDRLIFAVVELRCPLVLLSPDPERPIVAPVRDDKLADLQKQYRLIRRTAP